jgi:hypothetical protein
MENRTGYQLTSYSVRSVHGLARYTKIHVQYNILISGKLRYPANSWSWGCRISQILVYAGSHVLSSELHTLFKLVTAQLRTYTAKSSTVAGNVFVLSTLR